ncbi:zinc ribbon domain-containing protein [Haloarcula litorea]|uniref:zinc ribbon domain-containing protein n=1 Tax=Haloarcula litorea TaxID=3032579 RepID=UPI0023E7B0E5|nr:zinc ribbon domain-containing protein [Halomicroarcula sp. GDY20]
MVLETVTEFLRPDKTYTYECNDCGAEFETTAMRHDAECPDCGGPPKPTWQS